MPHTFISYAREDSEFAFKLAEALRAAGGKFGSTNSTFPPAHVGIAPCKKPSKPAAAS